MAVDQAKAGQRMRCEKCATEVVVVKPPDGVPQCCGQPLAVPAKK